MQLIIGLGNPDQKYKNTRHNVGFSAINNLQLTINNFSDFKLKKRLSAEISEEEINEEKIILAKPITFMNSSGLTVKKLAKFYKIKPENIWVIHDDLDIKLGKFKISFGRGSAGHKGVESIIGELKTKNFWRIRVGIDSIFKKTKNGKKFVLENFNKEEKETLKLVLEKVVREIKRVYFLADSDSKKN